MLRFLPAKPKDWKSGSVKGLLLRGGIVMENLEWQGESFKAKLRFADGNIKSIEGTAGDSITIFERQIVSGRCTLR